MEKLELLKVIFPYKLISSVESLNKKWMLSQIPRRTFHKNKSLENLEEITGPEDKDSKDKEDLEEKDNKVKEDLEEKTMIDKEDLEEKMETVKEDKVVIAKEEEVTENKEDLEEKMDKELMVETGRKEEVVETILEVAIEIKEEEVIETINQKFNGLKLVLLNQDNKILTY